MITYFRVNVGGKILTNHLKEIISYRYMFPELVENLVLVTF